MVSLPSDRSALSQTAQASVGQTLRARREELGWEIDALADWLRIRGRLLVALEADDLKAFPGTAYAVGFVRTYAQALQLDAEDLVTRFKRQAHGAAARKPDLVFPQPQEDRNIPVGVLIGAGLVVIVAAYAGWYCFASHDVPAERKVPAVAELMPGAATPLTTSPQVASVMPGQAPAPRADMPPEPSSPSGPAATGTSLPVPAPTSPASVAPQAPAVTTETTPETPEAQKPQDAPPVTSSPTVVTPETPAAAQGVPDGQIAVHALASVWTQIRDHDGHVVLGRVLQPGETWQGDASGAPYLMTFGNAGGVVLSTAAVTSAPLGRDGAVRRNVAVSADAIKSGAFGTGVSLPVPPAAALPEKQPIPPVSAPVQVVPRPRPVMKPSRPAEPSADDLNARQLDQTSASH